MAKYLVNNEGVVVLFTDTSDPTGTTGGIYFNTSTNRIRVYNGSSWEDA
jgi:hypothetical protein